MKNKIVRIALAFFAIFTMTITGAMANTIEKAKTTGKFTLAYRESSIPFSYLGEDGKPLGFGWEMCKLIAEEVKKETGRKDLVVESQAVTSQNRIPLIQNGINYHIDTNLLGGINYQYRVASINMTGDTSEFTDAFAYGVKKPDVSILNNFNVRNISEGIEVALPTVVFENRKYYRLYRKEEGENEYVNIGKIAADEFLFIDKNVVSNKYYTYSISVIDNEGREGVKCDAQSVKRD